MKIKLGENLYILLKYDSDKVKMKKAHVLFYIIYYLFLKIKPHENKIRGKLIHIVKIWYIPGKSLKTDFNRFRLILEIYIAMNRM